MKKGKLKVIDLFSGCGGLTLGFEMANFKTILANDVDENCKKTFNKNFPNIPFICKDIQLLKDNEIKKIVKNDTVDVIIGGPPCQGFSLANKNRNKIKDDQRNKLFYQFVRMVKLFQPKVFVMENVLGILSMGNGEVIKIILDEFKNSGIGYEVDKKVLNSANYGVPQTRERVIIIGVRKDLNKKPKFPTPKFKSDNYITVWEAISDLPEIDAGGGEEKQKYSNCELSKYEKKMRQKSKYIYNHIAMRHSPRLIKRFKAIRWGQSIKDVPKELSAVTRGDPTKISGKVFSQNNRRLFPNKPAPTIAASFQSNFIHPYLNRNFTAREGARLQSFPDSFIFEGMRTKMSWEKGLSQYQQIGNAVPPLMAKFIAEEIKKLIK